MSLMQGSVFGPLLFSLYVNELPSLYIYSYDIKLYRCIRSSEDCVQLQYDIDILLQWSKKWLLSLNVKSCISRSNSYTLRWQLQVRSHLSGVTR